MCIRTPNAKRTYPCPARMSSSLPFLQMVGYIERTLLQSQVRVSALKMKRRRDLSIFEHKRCFNQTCHPGRYIQMAHIRFYRTQGTRVRRVLAASIHLFERSHLYWISDDRSRSMCLDIPNRFWLDTRQSERLGYHLCLSLHSRCCIAYLRRAIVINSRSFNDGPNSVTCGQSIFQTF